MKLNIFFLISNLNPFLVLNISAASIYVSFLDELLQNLSVFSNLSKDVILSLYTIRKSDGYYLCDCLTYFCGTSALMDNVQIEKMGKPSLLFYVDLSS